MNLRMEAMERSEEGWKSVQDMERHGHWTFREVAQTYKPEHSLAQEQMFGFNLIPKVAFINSDLRCKYRVQTPVCILHQYEPDGSRQEFLIILRESFDRHRNFSETWKVNWTPPDTWLIENSGAYHKKSDKYKSPNPLNQGDDFVLLTSSDCDSV
ncbi:hypothetical protein CLF_104002 [Clonorchis sinensis]|uniref:Uncharacterized protein n=1 Tax=Clonorchis sinensis TaxID=79923 RepID=G7YAS2_CLOSI|nr:hypothetical protein CLF_104002 [Clonorchis sinensis]